MSPTSTGSLGRGARERILAAARERFAAAGINATGISELIAAARVSRRTLYEQFASKDELIVACLRSIEADPTAAPQRILARADLTPRARLLEMFAALGEGPRPLRGDPFLAASVELADPRHPARRLIARRQAALAAQLADLAREAGASARASEQLGARLAVVYAGASAAVLAVDDPGAVTDATAVARVLLEAALD